MTRHPVDPTIQCPLCGYRFLADELTCHSHCPLSRDCRVICCPHCSLSFLGPRRPAAAKRWRGGFWRLPWTRTTAKR